MFLSVHYLKVVSLVLFSVMLASPVFSANLHVPGEYATIQEGVDAAANGDTIIVADGTYVENIRIEKSITIYSENGAQNTFVQAQNPGYHVFEIWADQVAIEGFTITGALGSASASGIYIVSGYGQCVLLNNQVGTQSSANSVGIFIVDSYENYLEGNTVSNNTSNGIIIYRSTGLILKGNTIVQNNDYGIYCSGVVESQFIENVIKLHGNHYGMYLNGSSSNLISSNNFSDNYGDMEIRYSSSNNQIVNNTCRNGSYNAIYVHHNSNNNKISGNECTNYSYGSGIKLWATSSNEIFENIISGTQYGVSFQTVTDSLVYQNSCTGNIFSGINVNFNSQRNQIYSNQCTANEKNGINVYNSSLNEVRFNTCSNNGNVGLSLDSSQENIFSQNSVTDNAYGLSIEDSLDNRVFLNSFTDNDANIFSQASITHWQSEQEVVYTFQGISYTSFLGNFYSEHDLTDSNSDGVTDLAKDQPDIDLDDNYPLSMAHTFFLTNTPDMDSDNDVDGLDIAGFASALAAGSNTADLNQDALIDQLDIEVFADVFGK